jgi:hypothetical protein
MWKELDVIVWDNEGLPIGVITVHYLVRDNTIYVTYHDLKDELVMQSTPVPEELK